MGCGCFSMRDEGIGVAQEWGSILEGHGCQVSLELRETNLGQDGPAKTFLDDIAAGIDTAKP